MARRGYQYETSPRKLEPDYQRKDTKKKLEVIENNQKRQEKLNKQIKKTRKRQIFLIVSYRNSLIN